jgi:hypothetical protein
LSTQFALGIEAAQARVVVRAVAKLLSARVMRSTASHPGLERNSQSLLIDFATPVTAYRDPPADNPLMSAFDILLQDIPRLVGFLIAVSATLVAVAAYLRRDRAPAALAQPSAERRPKGIVYHDAPTIRMVDSQRIDRLRKVVRLAPGEHVDVLDTPQGRALELTPRFRVTLKRIVRMDDGTALAQVAVDFGGVAVSCGPLVEETAFNEFVLPRATRDEPRNSVFHYHESGDALDFMRIKLRGVDMDQDIAEIDVMQVSGHWPATD